MDEAASVSVSLKCPHCEAYLPSNSSGPSVTNAFQISSQASILATYTSEGGVQPDVDLLPTITEEAYLQNNPDARRAKAFQLMCSEGDIGGMVELLQEAADEGIDPATVVGYQDPLAGMQSGLHAAVRRGQAESAFLLLWICSNVPDNAFPEAARQAVQAMGVGRIPTTVNGDIRNLKDSQGTTAVQLAEQIRGELTGGGMADSWSSFLDIASAS